MTLFTVDALRPSKTELPKLLVPPPRERISFPPRRSPPPRAHRKSHVCVFPQEASCRRRVSPPVKPRESGFVWSCYGYRSAPAGPRGKGGVLNVCMNVVAARNDRIYKLLMWQKCPCREANVRGSHHFMIPPARETASDYSAYYGLFMFASFH